MTLLAVRACEALLIVTAAATGLIVWTFLTLLLYAGMRGALDVFAGWWRTGG